MRKKIGKNKTLMMLISITICALFIGASLSPVLAGGTEDEKVKRAAELGLTYKPDDRAVPGTSSVGGTQTAESQKREIIHSGNDGGDIVAAGVEDGETATECALCANSDKELTNAEIVAKLEEFVNEHSVEELDARIGLVVDTYEFYNSVYKNLNNIEKATLLNSVVEKNKNMFSEVGYDYLKAYVVSLDSSLATTEIKSMARGSVEGGEMNDTGDPCIEQYWQGNSKEDDEEVGEGEEPPTPEHPGERPKLIDYDSLEDWLCALGQWLIDYAAWLNGQGGVAGLLAKALDGTLDWWLELPYRVGSGKFLNLLGRILACGLGEDTVPPIGLSQDMQTQTTSMHTQAAVQAQQMTTQTSGVGQAQQEVEQTATAGTQPQSSSDNNEDQYIQQSAAL